MSEAETKPVEYERIWLAPWGADERTWCCDDVYEGEGVEYVLSSRLTSLMEENERLKAERDAAFAMSKCECGADEACRNLATAVARAQAAKQKLADAAKLLEPFAALCEWLGVSDWSMKRRTYAYVSPNADGSDAAQVALAHFRAARRFIKEAGE